MIKIQECVNIFWRNTNVFLEQTKGKRMSDNKRYFVVTEKAVPEVLLKVVEAKKTFGVKTDCNGTGSRRSSRNQQKFLL